LGLAGRKGSHRTYWPYRGRNDRSNGRNRANWSYGVNRTYGCWNDWSHWGHRTNGRYGEYGAYWCWDDGCYWKYRTDWSNRVYGTHRQHGAYRVYRFNGTNRSYWVSISRADMVKCSRRVF